jgi:hypothetical protein
MGHGAFPKSFRSQGHSLANEDRASVRYRAQPPHTGVTIAIWGSANKLKTKTCGSRTCKPNSPGCIASRQLIWNQSPRRVNDVNLGSDGRFCVTPASQILRFHRVHPTRRYGHRMYPMRQTNRGRRGLLPNSRRLIGTRFLLSDLTVWHKNYSLLPVQPSVRTRWSSLYDAL